MSLIELIGFLISIIGIFFLFFKKRMEEKRRRNNPEAYEKEVQAHDRRFKEFLRSLDINVDNQEEEEEEGYMEEAREMPKRPPPPPMVHQPPAPASHSKNFSRLEKYKLESKVELYEKKHAINEIEARKLKTGFDAYSGPAFNYEKIYQPEGSKPSRAKQLLRGLKTTQDIIILKEIIGPPKGQE